MRGHARPVFLALVLVAALFAASVGALRASLPRPSEPARRASRLLDLLDRTRGGGAELVVAGRRLVATCRPLSGRRYAVALDDGTRLVLAGTHVTRVASTRPRELLALEPADLVAAQADLVGSHDLLARELAGTLMTGRLLARDVTFRARPATVFRLERTPLVELVVDRATLTPLAARYRSATVSGSSTLRRAPAGEGC